MGLTWQDAEDIALALAEQFPDTDPLTVRFTDLHRWITELPGFADDPKASTEGKLEAVQMAWLEEYRAGREGEDDSAGQEGAGDAALPGDH